MKLASPPLPVFSFHGAVFEGLDGNIYGLEDSNDDLFVLKRASMVNIGSAFGVDRHDYRFNYIKKAGYGYIAASRGKTSAWKIYRIPGHKGRNINIPRGHSVYYNAEKDVALCSQYGTNELTYIDFSRRPKRIVKTAPYHFETDTNIDRLLAVRVSDGHRIVDIFSLPELNKPLNQINLNKLGVEFGWGIYPVSADSIVLENKLTDTRKEIIFIKDDKIVFRLDDSHIGKINSRGDRVVVDVLDRTRLLVCPCVYANLDSLKFCTIQNVSDTILTRNGIVANICDTHGWVFIPNEILEKEDVGFMSLDSFGSSSIFVVQAPIL